MEAWQVQIEEKPVEGHPLGRHIEHDPQSREFPWERRAAHIRSVKHSRHGGLFNQGSLGSCTGNAAVGAMNTVPFWQKGDPIYHESDAIEVYKRATVLDGFPGAYPPNDTGSSGLAVAKALLERKAISKYLHAFGITDAIDSLMSYGFICGINWYEGFDRPNFAGVVYKAGTVRGGHEILCREYDMVGKLPSNDDLLWFDNSWGTKWGVNGRFCMAVGTFEELLADSGDVTILIP